MTQEEIEAQAERIISILNESPDDADAIMNEVTDEYCRYCWRVSCGGFCVRDD